MSVEENKAVVRRLIEEVWNKGNLAVADEIIAEDNIEQMPLPPHRLGPQEYKEWVARTRAVFPDLHLTIDDMIGEGDKVMVRETWRGTQKAAFRTLLGVDLTATGRQVRVAQFSVFRLVNGRIVEYWYLQDALGMLEQLGALPAAKFDIRA
ncbi:MAG: ester cyclase [Bacteroidetes bacterium]|nr:ester cyclase [Bacteroidota bacterium]MCL5026888.1 ester cyclase [Chloroflexota bacterium]